MTAVISLVAIGALPSRLKLVAIALACIAALLLALTPEDAASDAKPGQESQ
jgi:hypothetical protein